MQYFIHMVRTYLQRLGSWAKPDIAVVALVASVLLANVVGPNLIPVFGLLLLSAALLPQMAIWYLTQRVVPPETLSRAMWASVVMLGLALCADVAASSPSQALGPIERVTFAAVFSHWFTSDRRKPSEGPVSGASESRRVRRDHALESAIFIGVGFVGTIPASDFLRLAVGHVAASVLIRSVIPFLPRLPGAGPDYPRPPGHARPGAGVAAAHTDHPSVVEDKHP